jgi:hypothetical protein
MARFSVYDFEKKGQVSIWVAIVSWTQLPASYFEAHYGREDDEPFTEFSEDFGFGFYDHDKVDTNGSEEAKPLEELLGECSFSSSYLTEAVAEAKKRGLDKTSFVFLLHDIEYQPMLTKVSRSAYMEFLGAFHFDSQATSGREAHS